MFRKRIVERYRRVSASRKIGLEPDGHGGRRRPGRATSVRLQPRDERIQMLNFFAIGFGALMHGMAHNIKFEMLRGEKIGALFASLSKVRKDLVRVFG